MTLLPGQERISPLKGYFQYLMPGVPVNLCDADYLPKRAGNCFLFSSLIIPYA
jgi:hypothetical protein